MRLQPCVSESLAECPGRDKMGRSWQFGWLGECGEEALAEMATLDRKHRGGGSTVGAS